MRRVGALAFKSLEEEEEEGERSGDDRGVLTDCCFRLSVGGSWVRESPLIPLGTESTVL